MIWWQALLQNCPFVSVRRCVYCVREQARLLSLQVQERLRAQPRLPASTQLGALRWRHPRWGHHRFRRRKGYVVVQQNVNTIAAFTTNLWKDWLDLNFVFAQATKRNSPVWTQRWDGAERLRRLEAQARQETGSRLTSRPQPSFGVSGHRYQRHFWLFFGRLI